MAKQFNGVFREWLRFKATDNRRTTIIWGYCVVHLSKPEFSGNVIHTSKILRISKRASFSIVETRNNFYALLGPELKMPARPSANPREYVWARRDTSRGADSLVNAAINANPRCQKCGGAGVYNFDHDHTAVCDLCCKHNVGWWKLEGNYGRDNGRWACKAGCGLIVDKPPVELQFLPRANV